MSPPRSRTSGRCASRPERERSGSSPGRALRRSIRGRTESRGGSKSPPRARLRSRSVPAPCGSPIHSAAASGGSTAYTDLPVTRLTRNLSWAPSRSISASAGSRLARGPSGRRTRSPTRSTGSIHARTARVRSRGSRHPPESRSARAQSGLRRRARRPPTPRFRPRRAAGCPTPDAGDHASSSSRTFRSKGRARPRCRWSRDPVRPRAARLPGGPVHRRRPVLRRLDGPGGRFRHLQVLLEREGVRAHARRRRHHRRLSLALLVLPDSGREPGAGWPLGNDQPLQHLH